MTYPTCKQPDRHVPAYGTCGYPLPCPWHTAIIDVSVDPARVVIPVTSSTGLKQRERLVQITRAISQHRRPPPAYGIALANMLFRETNG